MGTAANRRRVVVIYCDDTDSAEDLVHALQLLRGPSYLPFPDDWTPKQKRENPQPQMSDEDRKRIALEWLWRNRDKLHHGAQLMLPEDWRS